MVSDSYYQRNREAVLARRKAQRAADPERYRIAGRQQMKRWRATNPRVSPHHGLSPAQIAERLRRQEGKCALCATDKTKQWHGDHDHATGLFRAVLCSKCNMGLGLFNDSPARVRAAADYLDHHAALHSLL